jgi:RNA recognition motif-containing protein
MPLLTSAPPSVYARNLEERIKVDQLIESLRELFSEYGTIIDIVAKTNLKAKGQAFIVFDTVEGAQKAIDEVQGFELFGKEMQLAFAKTRSDATVKRQGNEEEFESHKRRRLAEKGMLLLLHSVEGFLLTIW